MNTVKKILKSSLFVFYFLLLFGIAGKLFFAEQFDSALNKLKSAMLLSPHEKTITVGFSEPYLSLDPLANDSGSRSRLLHIYEGIVKVAPDLKIEPGLAVSFGSLDDLTWEFRLRPNVFFHNGSALTVDDIVYSFKEAREAESSAVTSLVSTIKEVKKIDSQIFHIITNSPDPLLLSKISSILIFRKDAKNGSLVGTGPFELDKKENGTVALKRFEKYWGKRPLAAQVILKTFKSKAEKLAALSQGSVDIVANVPVENVTDFSFKFDKFKLLSNPSLEVNYLMFNFDGIFKQKALREAVDLAIKSDDLARLTLGFVATANQFVGNGIFGFDPTIPKRVVDAEKAQELVKSVSNFSRVKVDLDLPSGLEVFGANVREQLRKVGIDVELVFLRPDELSDKIIKHKSDFYFFGWKFELGDALDFLASVAHSPSGKLGYFNGGNYRNSEVDKLIEISLETMESQKRLSHMREAMRKITLDDIIGVPLFSPEQFYGVSTDIGWSPRVDGYILAQEIKM